MTLERLRDPARSIAAVCAVTLLASYALKECPGRTASALGLQCHTDVVALYYARHLDDRLFPYVHGALADGRLVGGAIEYPVLTGLFMWSVSMLVSTPGDYFRATVLLLAPFGVATAFLLARMAGRRALLWAAAPALLLYAFVNWELLVVAAFVFGLWLVRRGRRAWAAVAFGVGGALKLFPLLLLLPLSVERWVAGDRRGAVACATVGTGAFVLVNAPFAVLGSEGWWATYEFHRLREANYDSIWRAGIPDVDAGAANLASGVLVAASVAAAGVYGAQRRGADLFLPVAAASVAVFLLWSKVHSSQYALWIMPFFVLLNVSVVWWIVYSLADLVRFFGTLVGGADQALADGLVAAGVWARAALLAVLFFVFLRAVPVAAPDPPDAATRTS
ncbi:MAG: DUF2029 domain-containing protein [Thermoleophilia bacterium]|nr:DUF2029 domain-containing protein [Thermoleophilia bacterium]